MRTRDPLSLSILNLSYFLLAPELFGAGFDFISLSKDFYILYWHVT